MKKKLIPFLNSSIETSRAIDSLGILSQFLLDPTMNELPFTLKQLNDTMPDSLFKQSSGFRHEAQEWIMTAIGNPMLRRPFYSALLTTTASFAIIYIASTFAFGATTSTGFSIAITSCAVIFFGAYNEFKKQSSSNE
jgi:hypothetical protein